eukprot:scaffold29348_cov84-Isochrysis_galbana.AAC.1
MVAPRAVAMYCSWNPLALVLLMLFSYTVGTKARVTIDGSPPRSSMPASGWMEARREERPGMGSLDDQAVAATQVMEEKRSCASADSTVHSTHSYVSAQAGRAGNTAGGGWAGVETARGGRAAVNTARGGGPVGPRRVQLVLMPKGYRMPVASMEIPSAHGPGIPGGSPGCVQLSAAYPPTVMETEKVTAVVAKSSDGVGMRETDSLSLKKRNCSTKASAKEE